MKWIITFAAILVSINLIAADSADSEDLCVAGGCCHPEPIEDDKTLGARWDVECCNFSDGLQLPIVSVKKVDTLIEFLVNPENTPDFISEYEGKKCQGNMIELPDSVDKQVAVIVCNTHEDELVLEREDFASYVESIVARCERDGQVHGQIESPNGRWSIVVGGVPLKDIPDDELPDGITKKKRPDDQEPPEDPFELKFGGTILDVR